MSKHKLAREMESILRVPELRIRGSDVNYLAQRIAHMSIDWAVAPKVDREAVLDEQESRIRNWYKHDSDRLAASEKGAISLTRRSSGLARRANWRIEGLEFAMRDANINFDLLQHETRIDPENLSTIMANPNAFWRYRVLKRVESALRRRGVKVIPSQAGTVGGWPKDNAVSARIRHMVAQAG